MAISGFHPNNNNNNNNNQQKNVNLSDKCAAHASSVGTIAMMTITPSTPSSPTTSAVVTAAATTNKNGSTGMTNGISHDRGGKIETPSDHDVLLGRGKHSCLHEGNRHFRRVVEQNMEEYVRCKTRNDRIMMIRRIIDAIQSTGGRFLKRGRSASSREGIAKPDASNSKKDHHEEADHDWHVVDDKLAQEKVAHLIRDIRNRSRKEEEVPSRRQTKTKTKRISSSIVPKQLATKPEQEADFPRFVSSKVVRHVSQESSVGTSTTATPPTTSEIHRLPSITKRPETSSDPNLPPRNSHSNNNEPSSPLTVDSSGSVVSNEDVDNDDDDDDDDGSIMMGLLEDLMVDEQPRNKPNKSRERHDDEEEIIMLEPVPTALIWDDSATALSHSSSEGETSCSSSSGCALQEDDVVLILDVLDDQSRNKSMNKDHHSTPVVGTTLLGTAEMGTFEAAAAAAASAGSGGGGVIGIVEDDEDNREDGRHVTTGVDEMDSAFISEMQQILLQQNEDDAEEENFDSTSFPTSSTAIATAKLPTLSTTVSFEPQACNFFIPDYMIMGGICHQEAPLAAFPSVPPTRFQ